MATIFQPNLFQHGGLFQIEEEAAVDTTGQTILQRHKVDHLWSGSNLSRERYRRYKKQWAIDALNAKREIERKEREVQKDLGYRKIEYDKYGFEVAAGDAHFHQLLRSLEQAQKDRVAEQVRSYVSDAAARMAAARQFSNQALTTERMARMKQLERDAAEEEEALELLMMLDD
jgi:hypothetical protein